MEELAQLLAYYTEPSTNYMSVQSYQETQKWDLQILKSLNLIYSSKHECLQQLWTHADRP